MGSCASCGRGDHVYALRTTQVYEAGTAVEDYTKLAEEHSRAGFATARANSTVENGGGRVATIPNAVSRTSSSGVTQINANEPIPGSMQSTGNDSSSSPATINSSRRLEGYTFPAFSPQAGVAANILAHSGAIGASEDSFSTTGSSLAGSLHGSNRTLITSLAPNVSVANAGAGSAHPNPAIQVHGPNGVSPPTTTTSFRYTHTGSAAGHDHTAPPGSPCSDMLGPRSSVPSLPHRSVSISSAQSQLHAIPHTAQLVSASPGIPSISLSDDQAEIFLRIIGHHVGVTQNRQESVCSILRFAMAECEYHIQATAFPSSGGAGGGGSGNSPSVSPRSPAVGAGSGNYPSARSNTSGTGGNPTQRRLTAGGTAISGTPSSGGGVTPPGSASNPTGHRSSLFTPIFEAFNQHANKQARCRIRLDNKPVAAGFLRPLNNGVWITFDLEPPLKPVNYIFTIPPSEDDSDDSDEEEPEVAYRRGELIATGAYGAVYQGMNKRTGQLIAVKTISLSRVSTKGQMTVQQIEDEVSLLKQLNHEHIVKYLGTDRTESELNILLELVPGGSIASLVRRFGTFSESVIRLYTIQILVGLQYLHANNVIHRDIKGANILVTERGQIKLADFGLSTAALKGGAYGMVGTVNWMAPEVVSGGISVKSSDLWSLGCTVLEMTNGMPWKEMAFSNDFQAMFHISQNNIPAISPTLSPSLTTFLKRCFTLDPDQRPTCDDLIRDPFIAIPPSTVYEVVEEPIGPGTEEMDPEVCSTARDKEANNAAAKEDGPTSVSISYQRQPSPIIERARPVAAQSESPRSARVPGSIQGSMMGMPMGIGGLGAPPGQPMGMSRIDVGLLDRGESPRPNTGGRGAAGAGPSLSPFPAPGVMGVGGATGGGGSGGASVAGGGLAEREASFDLTESESGTPRTHRSGRPGKAESVVSFGSRVSIRRTSSHARMRKEVRAHKAHIRGHIDSIRRTSTALHPSPSAGGGLQVMASPSGASVGSGGASAVGVSDLPSQIGSPSPHNRAPGNLTSTNLNHHNAHYHHPHHGTSPKHSALGSLSGSETSSSVSYSSGLGPILAAASQSNDLLPPPPASVNLMMSDFLALSGAAAEKGAGGGAAGGAGGLPVGVIAVGTGGSGAAGGGQVVTARKQRVVREKESYTADEKAAIERILE